ncbi:MAG: Fe-S-containing hydro-lyase [Oscillospiraceae bacterium]|nr:Fe-S-containing hydro-lyase [Oscillospiraceae bacterium]
MSTNTKAIETPLRREDARALRCGESVLLSGEIYTARDAAHMRMAELITLGKPLPFPIEGAIIYYTGPTPQRPGRVIGSAGPTTSYRMDAFAPGLIKLGLTGMIGKGAREPDVIKAMMEYGAVYFGALGGAGALLARCVEASELVAYADLGPEAIRKLTVRNMPLTVVVDSFGNDLYKQGRADYLRWITRKQ